MLLSKHRSSILSKQVMNLPCVVKLAWCVLTNPLQCNEMPARWFEVLLHPWTTQCILYLKKSDNRLNNQKSAKILSSNAAFQFISMKITMWSFPVASLTSLPLPAPSLMLRGRNILINGGLKISRNTVGEKTVFLRSEWKSVWNDNYKHYINFWKMQKPRTLQIWS